MNDSSVSEVLNDWLDSYLNFERLPVKNIFWLDTIQFLCTRFDNPQDSCPSIHIAGSKGKGSVSTLVSSIIKENGLSCGLYTSPHITELIERITEAGTFFPERIYDAAFREMVSRVESIIPEELPNEREITWFELITLYSFLCFRQAHVDWGVFETGLGGRLDATNVLKPELCILTPIELEHTEFLGNTIPLIAGEKAGIIKADTPVFVSRQKPEAMEVFRRKAAEMNAPVFAAEDFIKNLNWQYNRDDDGACHTMHVDIELNGLFSRPLHADMRLLGEVQAQNAALAAAAVKHVIPDISEETVERGLSKAFLPGRFEITENPWGGTLILDGAHTANSLAGTLHTFKALFNPGAELIFGCAADKDMHALAELIIQEKSLFSHITLTKPGEVKKSDLPMLEKKFRECLAESGTDLSLTVEPDYRKAIEDGLKRAGREGKTLLSTGSFYLVSEVKKVLKA